MSALLNKSFNRTTYGLTSETE